MAYKTVPTDEITELVPDGAGGKWELQVTKSEILLHENPQKVRSEGRSRRPGDLDRIELGTGRGLYAFAPDESARVQISKANFLSELLSRMSAPTEPDAERTPRVATDDYAHAAGTDVDVNAATETVEFHAPDRADFAVIHVDDAAGAFHVEVSFLASDGGQVITQRTDGDDTNYAGSATSDVFQRVAIASPYVRIEIVDDSAAANALDYTIYAR